MGILNCASSPSEISKKSYRKLSGTISVMEAGKGIPNVCSQQPGNPQQNFFEFDEFSFNSKLDSGNLNFVQRIGPHSYNLWVNPEDPEENASGSNAWFYFEVFPRDVGPNETQNATFTIKNLPLDLQFSLDLGYRPVYHCIPNKTNWDYLDQQSISHRVYEGFVEMTIRFVFTGDDEKVAFAFSFPYNIQTCRNFLDFIETRCEKHPKIHFIRQVITTSLEKRPVECITFTGCCKNRSSLFESTNNLSRESRDSKGLDDEHQDPECYKNKKCILVTCRTNPGEAPSSYILEGFIRRILVANDEVSRAALNSYVFVVFPMVNPDGVFRGNMRTDSKGRELSRAFPKATLHHPAPLRIKQIARKLKEDGILSMTLDLRANYLIEGLTLNSTMYKNVAKDLPIGIFTRIFDIYSKYAINSQKVIFKSPSAPKSQNTSYIQNEEIKIKDTSLKENKSLLDYIYGYKVVAMSTTELVSVKNNLHLSKKKKEGCRLYMANYIEIGLALSIDVNFFCGMQRDNPYLGKDLYAICSQEERVRGSMIHLNKSQKKEDYEGLETDVESTTMSKSAKKNPKAKGNVKLYPKDYEEIGESVVLALVEFDEKHPHSILPQTGFTGMLHLTEFVRRYLIIENLD